MVGLAELTRQEKAGRIHELDAVRGFALCGIMLVNSWQQPNDAFKGQPDVPVDWVAENLLQSRFYPIFSFLFGVSLVLFLRSTDDDRWALFRRLVVLAGFGVLHTAVNPGEVLLPYAAFGLAVLLPAAFLPRLAVLVLGVAATAWAAGQGGGVILIPGLFLLGAAATEYRPSPGWWCPSSWSAPRSGPRSPPCGCSPAVTPARSSRRSTRWRAWSPRSRTSRGC